MKAALLESWFEIAARFGVSDVDAFKKNSTRGHSMCRARGADGSRSADCVIWPVSAGSPTIGRCTSAAPGVEEDAVVNS